MGLCLHCMSNNILLGFCWHRIKSSPCENSSTVALSILNTLNLGLETSSLLLLYPCSPPSPLGLVCSGLCQASSTPSPLGPEHTLSLCYILHWFYLHEKLKPIAFSHLFLLSILKKVTHVQSKFPRQKQTHPFIVIGLVYLYSTFLSSVDIMWLIPFFFHPYVFTTTTLWCRGGRED